MDKDTAGNPTGDPRYLCPYCGQWVYSHQVHECRASPESPSLFVPYSPTTYFPIYHEHRMELQEVLEAIEKLRQDIQRLSEKVDEIR